MITLYFVDLGNDAQADIEEELEERILEVLKMGISAQGQQTSRNIVNKHRNIFLMCLSSDVSADITPRKIELNRTKKRVRVRIRQYPKMSKRFSRQPY